jgi:predicted XRE-type DNA-binding protein
MGLVMSNFEKALAEIFLETVTQRGVKQRHLATVAKLDQSQVSLSLRGKRRLYLTDAIGFANALELKRSDIQRIIKTAENRACLMDLELY